MMNPINTVWLWTTSSSSKSRQQLVTKEKGKTCRTHKQKMKTITKNIFYFSLWYTIYIKYNITLKQTKPHTSPKNGDNFNDSPKLCEEFKLGRLVMTQSFDTSHDVYNDSYLQRFSISSQTKHDDIWSYWKVFALIFVKSYWKFQILEEVFMKEGM